MFPWHVVLHVLLQPQLKTEPFTTHFALKIRQVCMSCVQVRFQRMNPIKHLATNVTLGIVFLPLMHIRNVRSERSLGQFFATYLTELFLAAIVFGLVVAEQCLMGGPKATDLTGVLHPQMLLGLMSLSGVMGWECQLAMSALDRFIALLLVHDLLDAGNHVLRKLFQRHRTLALQAHCCWLVRMNLPVVFQK